MPILLILFLLLVPPVVYRIWLDRQETRERATAKSSEPRVVGDRFCAHYPPRLKWHALGVNISCWLSIVLVLAGITHISGWFVFFIASVALWDINKLFLEFHWDETRLIQRSLIWKQQWRWEDLSEVRQPVLVDTIEVHFGSGRAASIPETFHGHKRLLDNAYRHLAQNRARAKGEDEDRAAKAGSDLTESH